VRDLENRLKRAVLLAQGPQVTPTDLALDSPHSKYLAPGQGLREARAAFEKDLIQRVLSKHKGNISRTASALGVSRPTLHDLIANDALER
jgi:two-component system NtrC family response regulator